MLNKVYGPYDQCDWFEMKKLKENLTWYINNNLMEGYKKEYNIYLKIINK